MSAGNLRRNKARNKRVGSTSSGRASMASIRTEGCRSPRNAMFSSLKVCCQGDFW
jgi:hypothetical protein